MIKGRYIVKCDGETVAEAENVITNDGLNIIRNYLAGSTGTWAGSIAIGAMNNSAPSATDTALEFELTRAPILISSVEDSEIVLNATLGSEVEARIFELGVYPSVNNTTSLGFDDRVIATFSEDWTDSAGVSLGSSNFSGTETDSDGRSGYRNMIVGNSGISAYFDTGLNAQGYSQLDSVTMLYRTASTGADRTVRVTFYDDQLPTAGTKYYDFVLVGASTGYKKISALYGNFTETGNFNHSISQITITSTAATAATVHLDALKFDDADEVNLNFGLVSRALIGSVNGTTTSDYIVKPSGVQMDVEYRLELGA